MKKLNWARDRATSLAAQQFPLPIRANQPSGQFVGFNFDARSASWRCRVLPPPRWPAGHLVSSPRQILDLFAARSYLEALAMVVSWGGMGRTTPHIYGGHALNDIYASLHASASSIGETKSIAGAWSCLSGQGPGQLGWSPVFTSKTLHFLCRSLGFEQDCPVAIDNAVIVNRVWPAFVQPIPLSDRPGSWSGSTFEAYCRYMTAMLTWAHYKHWTTTQIEATVFVEYAGPNKPLQPTGCAGG